MKNFSLFFLITFLSFSQNSTEDIKILQKRREAIEKIAKQYDRFSTQEEIKKFQKEVQGFFDYLSYVFRSSPLIKAANKNVEKQQYKDLYKISEWVPDIQISGELGYREDFDVQRLIISGDRKGNRQGYTISITQNIFRGGQTLNKIKLYELEEDAAILNFAQRQGQVFLNALSTYLQVNRRQAIVSIYEKFYKLNKDLLKSVEQRYNLGDVKKSTFLLAKANFKKREIDLEQARLSLRVAQANYKSLGKLKSIDNIPEVIYPSFDLNKWELVKSEAFLNDPNLKLEQMQLKRTLIQHEISRGALYPQISVLLTKSSFGGDYNAETNRGSESASLVLNYDIQGGRIFLDYLSSKYDLQILENEINEKEREYLDNLRELWEENRSFNKRITFWQESVSFFNDNYKLINEEYQKGLVSIESLIRSGEELVSTQESLILSSYEELFSRYSILLRMGLFNEFIESANNR